MYEFVTRTPEINCASDTIEQQAKKAKTNKDSGKKDCP